MVEDDIDLNKAYCMILKHEGHEVVEAYDGKEALKKLANFEPELVLLDLLMPVMGGLEFLQKWATVKRRNVKVLIFTNMENSPEISQAYKLGANKCIIKSWTAPHNLSKVIEDTLSGEQEEKKSAKKVAKSAA